MGPPHKIEELGETQIPQEIFTDYLFDLSSNFTSVKIIDVIDVHLTV